MNEITRQIHTNSFIAAKFSYTFYPESLNPKTTTRFADSPTASTSKSRFLLKNKEHRYRFI